MLDILPTEGLLGPGVIFEGPDASGKSTLARKVSAASGKPLYLAGGKPRDDQQMWEMIADQAAACSQGKIVDRVSCISQQVYREGLFFRDDLMNEITKLVSAGNILVYCRPPTHIMMDPRNHEWKSYDTEEWKANILTNQASFIERYDVLMSKVPCVIYDWTSEDALHLEELLSVVDSSSIQQALRDLTRTP